MTTLTKTYATEVAARRAVEALRATSVRERDIRLLVGSAPRDIRREPVGGFAAGHDPRSQRRHGSRRAATTVPS